MIEGANWRFPFYLRGGECLRLLLGERGSLFLEDVKEGLRGLEDFHEGVLGLADRLIEFLPRPVLLMQRLIDLLKA